ncbi:hypothetical protein SAMN02746065_10854 [Desulfocicer vacuolatum DSM 3385]|uniref:Uncharacterized protein n=1 Tax=Desulfocicer vacuolatum DSM 3385 TaxID=1121400 RepID=A0A1W2BGN9_9BACT|nr:hypothetical protein [Desulfocicer vacuolatum]SMC71618.1 hypothetical protein SAMN02746065_10854 [Desulfocicer vacuolatum DSM 3385]
MTSQTTCIPWHNEKEWQEITLFFDTVKRVHATALDPVVQHARQISELFESLSRPMDDLCTVTCINCEDICCQKATIWYDFKDLLYLYFAFGRLPAGQIAKHKDPTGHLQCHKLLPTGCLLSRLERPFVCTWYLCPAQKQIFMSGNGVNGKHFMEKLNQIKRLRNEMESKFCRLSAGV